MNRSKKRPPALTQQGPPTAPNIPTEAFIPENPFEGFMPLLEAHEEERLAKSLAGEGANPGEQDAPQAKKESTAEGRAHEDKVAEKPVGLPAEEPAEATVEAGETAKVKAEGQTTEEAKEEGKRANEEAAELPSETLQAFPPDVDDAGGWYDDREFLTLRRDEGLADLPAVRLTPSSLSKVVSEAKKLGKKANELNRTGAHQRHLAVIARWYEGDRWLAIHEFLVAQGRRPEWVPLYEGAGLTAKQISRATRLRRAFANVEDLKKITTLEEAEALATNILNKKDGQSAGAKAKTPDAGAGAGSSLVAPATASIPDTGTGQEAPDEGEADEPKAHIKKARKHRNKGASGEGGTTLPPDPVEALESECKRQYRPDHLLDMGVQMIERALGRAVVDDKPFRVDAVLDDLATLAVAAADKKVQDIDKEDGEAQQSVQRSLKTLFEFMEGPARLLDPTWLLKVATSWVSLATDETLRLKWDDPKTQCDVDKALDSISGNLLVLKKRREQAQQ
jgi:hypothetical protein